MSKLISIIVPTHNERDNVPVLYSKLVSVFDALTDCDFELIFADDSNDETPAVICGLNATDGRVKLVRLSRQFNQAIAITAGLERARGDAVVMMDADLQDSPEAIPQMIQLWKQGYQAVYAQRSSDSDYRLYRLFAWIFYRLAARISSIDLPRDAGEFRLLDGSVLGFLKSLTEHTRYLRGLTLWPVRRSIALPIERQPRARGKTKYHFRRSLLVALDGFASFSVLPLRLSAGVGLLLAFVSLLVGTGYLLVSLLDPKPFGRGWPSLFVSIWFLSGVQLFFVGVLGEYLGRIYIEVQNRPLYWVDYEVGFGSQTPERNN